jgi:sugar lactone lactonase YvrE
MKKIIINLLLFTCFSTAVLAQTQRITFKVPKLYPEGLAFDAATKSFYVSSVKTVTIGKVDQNGNYSQFYADKDLISSFGMKVDAKNNRLLICLSDPNENYSIYSSPATFKKMARVIAIDLKTAKRVMDVDLSGLYQGEHFINDLVMDKEGNLYLTDSFSPVVYKVDQNGKPSIFAQNELFRSLDIGLNGIAYDPSGNLFVVNNSNGSIIRISLADPKKIDLVKTDTFFSGADGLLFERGELILVQNKGTNKVFRLSSSDNWKTARISSATTGEDRFAQPSTLVADKGQIWVLNSKLNELANPALVPSKEFSVQLAVFKPVAQ